MKRMGISVYRKQIGSRIFHFRNLRKMTQEDLAMGAGYSKASAKSIVSQIESGKKMPSLDKLFKLAEKLDCHPYVLLMRDKIPEEKLEAMNLAAKAILK